MQCHTEILSNIIFSGWLRTGPEKCPEGNSVEHDVDERECFDQCYWDTDCMAFRLTPPCRTWSWSDEDNCREGADPQIAIFKKTDECKYFNVKISHLYCLHFVVYIKVWNPRRILQGQVIYSKMMMNCGLSIQNPFLIQTSYSIQIPQSIQIHQ